MEDNDREQKVAWKEEFCEKSPNGRHEEGSTGSCGHKDLGGPQWINCKYCERGLYRTGKQGWY